MNKLLSADSSTVYLVLLAGCLLVALFLLSILGGKGGGKAPARKKKSGSLHGLTLLLLAFSALLLLYFVIYLYYFTPLRGEMQVARVEFQKNGTAANGFRVIVIPYENGEARSAKSCAVRGELWALQGEVLQWKPFFGRVGLRSMFRLTAVEGYERRNNSLQRVSTATLAGGSGEVLWKLAHGLNALLRWAQVTTCRSSSTEPLWSGGYDLYADRNGLRLGSGRVAPAPAPLRKERAPERERRYPRRPDEVRH
ncbi:MAG TPA: hypothetical protein PKI62_08835 [bacterium]|nr:hypothetical protein [bacterium]HPR86555.1 hypothetical protein [bacterium]